MSSINRVLWLCKARYMNHDVIADRYARLFELPERLGEYMEVRAFCLDYRGVGAAATAPELEDRWRRLSLPGTLYAGWYPALLAGARAFRPDCIVASSDCLQVILGRRLASVLGVRFVADLYDDYASFGLARLPGVARSYRRALARADGVTVVSSTLGEAVQDSYPGIPVKVLESTISAGQFEPQDREESLGRLGLADLAGHRLVGVSGGLNASHGIDVVFGALPAILDQNPDVIAVVAGRLQDCPLPDHDRIRYLGTLPFSAMPAFYSTLDVAVVALSDSTFGRYAFPQKAYELLSCRVPLVAADVGALSRLLVDHDELLYEPRSSASLARAVSRQLQSPVHPDIAIPTWQQQAHGLADFLRVIGTT